MYSPKHISNRCHNMRTMFSNEILTVRDGLFAAADPTTARRVTAESFILVSRVRRENLKVLCSLRNYEQSLNSIR